MDFQLTAEVCKVDDSLGIVFGWGIVCTEDGQPYVDLQEDHVTAASMLRASAAFAKGSRIAKDMHVGEQVGTILYLWPMTADIAKAIGVQSRREGLLVGMLPDGDMLAKFKSGEYRGFSIGGRGKRRRVTA